MESITSNSRYTIRNGDRSEGGARMERIIFNTCYTVRDSNRSQTGATPERTFSNTRYRSVKGDYTLTILVCIANDTGTEDVGCIWCNDIAIGGCVEDLPCRVDTSLFHELTHILCPIGCFVCCFCSARDMTSSN